MRKYHLFHLVDPSPWPFLSAVALFNLVVSFVGYIHSYDGFVEDLVLHFFNLALVAALWWRDVVREATHGGHHTRPVREGLKMGFVLFLVSEGMLFFSLFWTFFYLSVHPGYALGTLWSAHLAGEVAPADTVPLVNTYLLLWSGATLTYSHYRLLGGDRTGSMNGLLCTLGLGFVFLTLQGVEYRNNKFDISDGVFGSTFYLLTGFHGLHVVIGWVFLAVAAARLDSGHLDRTRHLGYEMAIWYWHFVDVVWLFLFFSVYVWGTYSPGEVGHPG